MPIADIAKIEERLDKVVAGAIKVSTSVGGLRIEEMVQVMETAKMMATSGPAIPKWLQGNVGGCWAVMIMALEWEMSPIGVARMSFEVNGVVGYMSQIIHALIEKRAPLMQRLRCAYEGEGDQRVCIVTGQFKGETSAVEYRSPPLGKITPKNSPLWKTDSDQQLWYYSSRAWARRYAPEVLLGIYSKDELEDAGIGPDNARNITPPKPDIASRLKGGGKGRGFAPANVDAIEANPATKPAPKAEPPLTRAARLLAQCRTFDDVTSLELSVSEELADDADRATLHSICELRLQELA